MNTTKRSARRPTFGWRSLMSGACAVAALALSTPGWALTNIGPGAFSAGATKITFEDLPGNGPLPAGYGSGSGISFTAGTESEVYVDYGGTLAAAATSAGLGNVAGTWGCNGTCGTGFSLSSARQRVGAYLSSNVAITVQVSAYRGATLLGSQTPSFTANQIGFVGFEDSGGIDRIVIGPNTDCSGCIHQVDNVMFENAAAAVSVAVPTMSEWGLIILSALLALVTFVALRKRAR